MYASTINYVLLKNKYFLWGWILVSHEQQCVCWFHDLFKLHDSMCPMFESDQHLQSSSLLHIGTPTGLSHTQLFFLLLSQLPSLAIFSVSYKYDWPKQSTSASLYPRLHLQCTSGHSSVKDLVLESVRSIQTLALQHLPCLRCFRAEKGFQLDEAVPNPPELQCVVLSQDLQDRKLNGRLKFDVPEDVLVLAESNEDDVSRWARVSGLWTKGD